MKKKARQRQHLEETAKRWLQKKNTSGATDQCGSCDYFYRLADGFGEDWGVCTNEKSDFDANTRNEHDSCAHYKPSPTGWNW
jgi:hypothetical protein